jgi:hypothetical protein
MAGVDFTRSFFIIKPWFAPRSLRTFPVPDAPSSSPHPLERPLSDQP